MKYAALFLLIGLFSTHQLKAQDFSDLEKVEFKTADECRTYDTKALECASYLLSTPLDETLPRLRAASFVIKWMSATADYTFNLGKTAIDLTKKNDNLIGNYMAALAKFSLENKDKSKDEAAVQTGAITLFLQYCKNPDNHVKITKELKKAIESLDNGTLPDYIKK